MITIKDLERSVWTMYNNKVQECKVASMTFYSRYRPCPDDIAQLLIKNTNDDYHKDKSLRRTLCNVYQTKKELVESL